VVAIVPMSPALISVMLRDFRGSIYANVCCSDLASYLNNNFRRFFMTSRAKNISQLSARAAKRLDHRRRAIAL
jgi:hypothetical protein